VEKSLKINVLCIERKVKDGLSRKRGMRWEKVDRLGNCGNYTLSNN
jgi:hypothetical protein